EAASVKSERTRRPGRRTRGTPPPVTCTTGCYKMATARCPGPSPPFTNGGLDLHPGTLLQRRRAPFDAAELLAYVEGMAPLWEQEATPAAWALASLAEHSPTPAGPAAAA